MAEGPALEAERKRQSSQLFLCFSMKALGSTFKCRSWVLALTKKSCPVLGLYEREGARMSVAEMFFKETGTISLGLSSGFEGKSQAMAMACALRKGRFSEVFGKV